MAIDLLRTFALTWGETGGAFDWNEAQYRQGWSAIGDIPPSVEQFNAVHQIADKKSNYLYRQMAEVARVAGKNFTPASNNTLRESIEAIVNGKTPDASTSVKGVVKLNNTLTSTSTSEALTAAQGKVLAGLINDASNEAFKNQGQLTQNLNDLKGTSHYGVWHQPLNAGATADKNYPIEEAGTLFVLPSAYEGVQLYFPFAQSKIYMRNTHNNGVWREWRTIGDIANDLNTADGTIALSAAQGKILAERIAQISRSKIDADDSVNLTGAQTITGTKTFNRIHINNAENPLEIGRGSSDFYFGSRVSSKYLQLKDDGTLSYSNDKILLNSMRSNAVNDNNSDKIATSAAVKTAYDKAVAALSEAETKLDATANAVSASKLQTARTINGVAFDGTRNITVEDNSKLPATGGSMTGILYVKAGEGQGIKSAGDKDTGIEFLQDGLMIMKVNSRLRQSINTSSTDFYNPTGAKLSFQNNNNLVITSSTGTVLWSSNETVKRAEFTYQKIQMPAISNAAQNWPAGGINGNDCFEVRKYPDGTLIQIAYIEATDVANAADGRKDIVKPVQKYQFAWPVSFVSKPRFFHCSENNHLSHLCGISIHTDSNNSTCYWSAWETSATVQNGFNTQIMAIGRWK